MSKCKEVVEQYSRIVGYMRPISQWNEGKAQEYKDRVEYNLNKVGDYVNRTDDKRFHADTENN